MQPRIFEIVWAIAAIGLGGIGVFGTDWYIAHTKKWALWFYEKTKFPFYKMQAEQIEKPYMRILSKIIGFAFIVLGFTLLLGMWHTGPQ